MNNLTFQNAMAGLSEQVLAAFDRQILTHGRRDTGGIIRPDWGIDDPTGNVHFLGQCGLLYLAQVKAGHSAPMEPDSAALLHRADLAVDYLLRTRHPSGLIDLKDCNFDSAPDAGFAAQALCPVIEMGRAQSRRDAAWGAVLGKIEELMRGLTYGMLIGGFHTPNHRWVISGGLAMAGRLFPDIPVKPVIEAYLREGIDIDSEGFYIERSAGLYDAICDRSLLYLDEFYGCPEARKAANKNLALNLHMLHADKTVESGLSRRQDYGARTVPAGLVTPYLLSAYREANPQFLGAAQQLYAAAPPAARDNAGLCYLLLKHGEPPQASAPLPDHFSNWYPSNGFWRVRDGLLSATFFRGQTRLLNLCYGAAELSSIKISQSYFGAGSFVGDSLKVENGQGVFRSEGLSVPNRPGYDLPLPGPVPPERWDEMRKNREHRPLPPCTSELSVKQVEDGFDLHYKTLKGTDGVPAQIALDFAPGGAWESEDSAVKPVAGQVLFLKKGRGVMRYGSDVIEIGQGADGHRMWQMRDAETAPSHVRVLMTFQTPVDHAFHIRCYRGVGR
jgi:hypothetical protein